MLAIILLLRNIIDVLILICILRIWIYYTIKNTYNTFAQFIIKISQPIIQPFQILLPNIKNIELSTLILLFILVTIKYPLLVLLNTKTIPLYSFITLIFIGILVLFKSLGNLIFWLITIRTVFSWFDRKANDFDYILNTLTDQIMYPIKKIILPIGNIDVIPFVISLVLYCLNILAMDIFPQFWFII
ncbi:YggT family protein [Enterobacteriaceae endosymbiont of Neohaemonia nigricornis]|uniref:YggT family protein n=1 Tax=Enterobacteriaceae endosymbiont of Neohaemonia nigricornis TaxID=2675792 RepID=UPI0014494364|nr:YggT family protein [Enterobacteriaceae endosymbiont of Neohaemonia nigricornis]QJC30473.1 hypothetical protein GJT85_01435 [Enterobacteriaceae endosymbiont of Neohaemonia nigricornis]